MSTDVVVTETDSARGEGKHPRKALIGASCLRAPAQPISIAPLKPSLAEAICNRSTPKHKPVAAGTFSKFHELAARARIFNESKPANIADLRRANLEAAQSSNLRLEQFADHGAARPYDRLKRVLDFLGANLLLIITLPLFAIIAIAVRIDSPGPAIFRQRRLTDGGREFTILKFRTMRSDAERHTGAVWAESGDPRVTRVGRLLRNSRLDELPQFINVICGEMSLIGPRPERPEFASKLAEDLPGFNRRLRVKAGITGLAQTSSGYAASVSSYRKKLACDILYVRKRSLLLDLRIALRTIIVVITGNGAR
jgi:lipopolysaccharide/colanic/teichoic acid biosynthesis glycosyltransferase